MKTLKMTRFLDKTLLVVTLMWLLTLISCDTKGFNGKVVKIDGMYYRLDCRAGNLYALEPIDINALKNDLQNTKD